MRKKAISLTLATAMVLTGLVACSSSSGTSSTADNTTKSAAAGSDSDASDAGTSSGDSNDPYGASFAGYPMESAKDITITWYVNQGFGLNAAYGSAADSPFHSGLTDMTGVTIDWQFPTAGTDATQDFNLMLASDTLPDIIYGPMLTEAGRYMDEGVITDLSEYIQTYSPAYYEWLQSNEMYDKAMKTDDGKYIGYGFFREDGGWNDSFLGPVVRQDWLDEQGLEIPKTISEFENVIKVFKEKYNAQFSSAWSRFNSIGLAGAFGAHGGTSYQIYVDDNGKIQLAQAQSEWLDYMKKLNEWWNDGLLDKDIVTLDDSAEQTKALNALTGISFTSMGQISNWGSDAENAGNGAEWVGIPYPTADDGTISSVFGGYGIGPSLVGVISQDCAEDKIPIAMRLLDYAYTEDGSLYWNFGKEGVSWDYNSDGEVEYTSLVTDDADGLNNAVDKYGGATWSGSCIQATRLLYLKNTETAMAANDTWYYTYQDATYKDKMPAGVSFTADESNEKTELETSISTYVNETATKYMTGEESTDTYDDFLAQLDSMGLSRLLEIYQAAYDRFMAR